MFQTKYGSVRVMDLVGKKYGSRVSLSKGWGQVLYPTPELWTVTLPHRTQILYTPDISMVSFGQQENSVCCNFVHNGKPYYVCTDLCCRSHDFNIFKLSFHTSNDNLKENHPFAI